MTNKVGKYLEMMIVLLSSTIMYKKSLIQYVRYYFVNIKSLAAISVVIFLAVVGLVFEKRLGLSFFAFWVFM